MRYGRSAQKQLPRLTAALVDLASTEDPAAIGDLLHRMITIIDEFSQQSSGSLFNVFRSQERLLADYEATSQQLLEVQKQLNRWRLKLTVSVRQLDTLYSQTATSYQKLIQYLHAGHLQLAHIQGTELPELQQQANLTQAPSDILAYRSLAENYANFNRRLSDLEVTKTGFLQTALQIRLLQATYQQLILQIHTSLSDAISAWQRDVTHLLSVRHHRQAFKAPNSALLSAIQQTITTQQEGSERHQQIVQSNSAQQTRSHFNN